MKNLTQFLFMLLCICLPATAFADANKDKDDDSKYLAGAVPEVDGKVVFTKEFSIPGMSQEEIFKRMQAWMDPSGIYANGNAPPTIPASTDRCINRYCG